MNSQKCKEQVYDKGGWHRYQCTRNIWKDGFCKIHHPATVEERRKKSRAKWDEKWSKSPEMQLIKALNRIKELEFEIKRLKNK